MCPFFLDPRRAPIPSCSSSTSYWSSSLSALVVLVQDVVHGICSVFLVRHPQLLHVLPSPYLTHWYELLVWPLPLLSATTSHLVSHKHRTQTNSTKSFYIHLNNHSSYLDKGSSNLVWSVSSHSPGHEPSQEKLEPYAAVASSNMQPSEEEVQWWRCLWWERWGRLKGGAVVTCEQQEWTRALSFGQWTWGQVHLIFLAASDNVCQVLPNFFHIQEAFIKTSKAIHGDDTKP